MNKIIIAESILEHLRDIEFYESKIYDLEEDCIKFDALGFNGLVISNMDAIMNYRSIIADINKKIKSLKKHI